MPKFFGVCGATEAGDTANERRPVHRNAGDARHISANRGLVPLKLACLQDGRAASPARRGDRSHSRLLRDWTLHQGESLEQTFKPSCSSHPGPGPLFLRPKPSQSSGCRRRFAKRPLLRRCCAGFQSRLQSIAAFVAEMHLELFVTPASRRRACFVDGAVRCTAAEAVANATCGHHYTRHPSTAENRVPGIGSV